MTAFNKKPNPACFERQLKSITKKFPKSENSILNSLDEIYKDPLRGDRIPGLGSNHLRKIRVPLVEYKISKRKGLRVILLLIEKEGITDIINTAIYYKGDYKSEDKITESIKKNLREIFKGDDE
jgi:hypothetical protein